MAELSPIPIPRLTANLLREMREAGCTADDLMVMMAELRLAQMEWAREERVRERRKAG